MIHPFAFWRFSLIALISLGSSAFAASADLKQKLQDGLNQRLDVLQEPLKAWDTEYRVQLEKLEGAVRENGQLDLVLEVRKTIEAAAEKIEAPESKAEPIRKLYRIYESKRKRLELAAAQQRVSVIKKYGEQLVALEKKLTKANEIQDALTVRATLTELRGDLQQARTKLDAITPKLKIPAPPPAIPAGPPPVLQGVDRVVRSPNADKYPTYRDEKKHSWWIYGYEDAKPLTWETEKVTPNHTGSVKPATFIWAGAIDSHKAGTLTLHLNDQALFDVKSEVAEDQVWKGKGCTLAFKLKRFDYDSFGIFTLEVPAKMLVPNKPQTLKFTGGGGKGWFMLNDYDDVAE